MVTGRKPTQNRPKTIHKIDFRITPKMLPLFPFICETQLNSFIYNTIEAKTIGRIFWYMRKVALLYIFTLETFYSLSGSIISCTIYSSLVYFGRLFFLRCWGNSTNFQVQ